MSVQAVADFLEKLNDEESLKAELDLKGKTKQERIASAVVLAGKHGFEFTKDECAAVLDTVEKAKGGELEDAELEAVAGGVALPEETWAAIKNEVRSAIYDIFVACDEDDPDDTSCHSYDDDERTAVAGVRG